MRYLCMVVLLSGLLAATSWGEINVKVTADDSSLSSGQTTTIRVLAQGSAAGIASLAGSINASGTAGLLNSNAGSLAWVPAFASDNSTPPNFPKQLGAAGPNGGWSAFGSMQTNYGTMDPTYGKIDFVEVAHYTVTAMAKATSDPESVSLQFSGSRIEGFKPVETDLSTTMGSITPVTITVTPEPITLSLLALGGLVAARRRSR